MKSISSDSELMDLAGISINNFKFLLSKLKDYEKDNFNVTLDNRLLILLMKLKTGLSFSALGILFCKHRTSISRIFYGLLHYMACVTADFVFWPSRDVVQATMPNCFKPEYAKTRVIIDCTEFKIENPASVDNRVYCYSHYKKGFTAELLVGITPSGFICSKYKVAGGKKSDSHITVQSGLINLLEEGDEVLAAKSFPEIKEVANKEGKNIVIVMPPILENKVGFTKEETEKTYKIASVRIHVERIMQRLRTYQILNKIPHYLFSNIDIFIHVCCILVNLQSPIFSEEENV